MTTPKTITTTNPRVWLRAAVSAVVGSAISYLTVKLGNLNLGSLAIFIPAVSAAYYAAVQWLEKKFPSFGWLLGILPQPKNTDPTPTPAPTPAPAKGKGPKAKA